MEKKEQSSAAVLVKTQFIFASEKWAWFCNVSNLESKIYYAFLFQKKSIELDGNH